MHRNHGTLLMRAIWFILGIFLCLGWGQPAKAASAPPVTVLLEGEPLEMSVPPVIVDNRTLIGVRFIGEAVGGTVEWDPVSRRVTVVSPGGTVVLTIGDPVALVNGQPVTMEVPAQLVADRTMVPLRFIAEALGCTVEWDQATRTVNILLTPAKITGLTYETAGGGARVRLTLSAPLRSVQPRQEGTSVFLDLYPAEVAGVSSEYPIYDGLTRAVRLISSGRTTTLQAELWDVPSHRYTLSPDGRELILEFDPMVRSVGFHQEVRSPQVVIATTGEVAYSVREESSPRRLVVDIEGAPPGPGVVSPLQVNHPAVSRITTVPYGSGTRVTVELQRETAYHVVSTPVGLEIHLLPTIVGVRTEPYVERTRLILESSLPVDASVVASGRQLLIEIPQGRSGLSADVVTLNDDLIRQVTLRPSGPESLLVTVDLAYYAGHTVISQNGQQQVVVDLARSPLYGKRIWIDAGHGKIPGGADDPGAIGTTYGTREKVVNLEVALALQRLLEEAGAIVYMTRTGDEGVDFRERPALVNAVDPPVDLFISIHHNSASNPSVRGVETYYWITNPQSKKVAQYVHDAVVEALGFPDRGVRQYDFWVIKETLAPSILVELGFLSNPDEEYVIAEPGQSVRTYPERAARGIFQGITNYYWQEIR